MKKVKDVFQYHEKWGTGGGCYCCKYSRIHYGIQTDWPVKGMNCVLYNINLSNMLIDGYLGSDFFCKNIIIDKFSDCFDLDIFQTSFQIIKDQLEENVLYEACQKEYLCMIPFDELEKIET
jgi:hypothetical protein